ncbi:MAG: TRAP transporter substrate-binding protein, partial [Rhodobacterales bacterium]|nr:TRAP transporter substrate-binding protein [Rhodobacterales bacterium]
MLNQPATSKTLRKIIGTVLVASIGIIALPSTPTCASTISIKLGHDMAESSPHHQATVRWKELVEERSGGDVTVRIFPSSILGSATQMVEQVQAGALEAAMLPNAQIAPIAPKLSVLDLPFLFANRQIAHGVVDGPAGEVILKALDGTGIVGVAHWESGFKQFTSNFPIHTPEDFVGHKIRTMPSQVVQAQFRAFGAVPVQMAFSELYSALQQGTVDGQENPIATIAAGKLYEVQPYISLSDHAFLGEIFMINQVFYDNLDSETRDIL